VNARVRHGRLISLVESKRRRQNPELAIGGRGVLIGFNTVWKDGRGQEVV